MIRSALLSAAIGAAYVAAMVHEHRAHAAETRASMAALAVRNDGMPVDTVTILTPAATLTYLGTLDTFSTSVARLDFSADDARADPPIPALGPRRGPYRVTISAPDAIGFAGDGCALVSLDVMAGQSHAILRCPE